ncbi:methyl-accepting chemotaxis protein [Sporosarcina sp. FSL W7-1349]|uniref:methyl-accepting chemotaxis protein n=1 Tax=Sporosarcina sp. FSL W7-1349 TaxID=2921561 RepID=UPI0030F7D615
MKKLQTKFLLFILAPTILFFLGMGIYISFSVHSMVKEEAEIMLETHGELLAEELKVNLEHYAVAAQTISHSIEGLFENKLDPTRDDVNILLQQLLTNDPSILTTWTLWEVNSFDDQDAEFANTSGSDETGRFIPVWSRDKSGKFSLEPIIGYDQPGELKDNFDHVLQTGENVIFEPFSYQVDGIDTLMTSIVSPITIHGKTVGMVGIDISLQTMNDHISKIRLYDNGFAGLMSNRGGVISHQNNELIGKNYFQSTAMKDRDDVTDVENAVHKGEPVRIVGFSDALQTDVYRLFTPIQIDGVQTPWSAFIAAPINEVTAKATALTRVILITNIVLIIILTVIIITVSKGITNVLRRAVAHGQLIADGDFTLNVNENHLKRRDELGDLARIFIAITKQMGGLMGKIKESASQVTASAESVDVRTEETRRAANEVTSAIEKVAESAEVQMQSTEESAKAMGDMAHGIQTVAYASTAVSEITNEMLEKANNGQKVVHNAVQQMDVIRKGTSDTKTIIEQLEEEANKIQDIVSVITSISEQTNLLALNAAIEAARAGEYGKGFAVVADEVRKLADETNGSAGDIQQLLAAIQADTVRAAESMEMNEHGVQSGLHRMHEVETVFNQIITSVEMIVKETIELSAVAEEMSAGSEEIAATSEAMAESARQASDQTHQVAAASEQQLASMEEIANASVSLKKLADELNQTLTQFNV